MILHCQDHNDNVVSGTHCVKSGSKTPEPKLCDSNAPCRKSKTIDLYYIISYYMLSYYMLCYVMLCYVMLCYVVLCYVVLCCVMLCCVMLCCVMLCYVMLCYVMLCYVMLCYVMLCYVMLCYVIMTICPKLRGRRCIDNVTLDLFLERAATNYYGLGCYGDSRQHHRVPKFIKNFRSQINW